MLAQVNDTATSPERAPRRARRARNVYISVFGPSKTRGRWWFTGRCGRCGSTVFGAAKAKELLAGPRRLSCGHVGWLIPARTYLSKPDSAAAS